MADSTTDLGPLVQNIVSLTTLLRRQLTKYMPTILSNTLFLLEKCENCKRFSVSNKKYQFICNIYVLNFNKTLNVLNFNKTLTNDVLSLILNNQPLFSHRRLIAGFVIQCLINFVSSQTCGSLQYVIVMAGFVTQCLINFVSLQAEVCSCTGCHKTLTTSNVQYKRA